MVIGSAIQPLKCKYTAPIFWLFFGLNSSFCYFMAFADLTNCHKTMNKMAIYSGFMNLLVDFWLYTVVLFVFLINFVQLNFAQHIHIKILTFLSIT